MSVFSESFKFGMNVVTVDGIIKPKFYTVTYALNCNCDTDDLLHDISGRIKIAIENLLGGSIVIQEDMHLLDALIPLEELGMFGIITIPSMSELHKSMMDHILNIIKSKVDLGEGVTWNGFGLYSGA